MHSAKSVAPPVIENVWLYQGDCVEVMRQWPGNSVDAVVCDPPYGLSFMGKEFDKLGEGTAQQKWHEAWLREALRVLKPGGHLLAFGGSRTYHRLACAVEDVGFEIRDSLMWLYGSGFPKSLNIGDGRGTALKPAHEPIVMGRKPLEGTVASNVQKWGTGALNIDGCRVELKGRWPANVMFDEQAAAMLDAQSGTLKSGAPGVLRTPVNTGTAYGAESRPAGTPMRGFGDSGGASRFFYVAKTSRRERDHGLESFPTRSAGDATDRDDGTAGLNSPRAGAGRTGGAKNIHPTVKPVALMRHLCRLVTPDSGIVLDPFVGSGTTGMAARLEGFRFIGIEKEAEYLQLAHARIAAALTLK